MSFEIRQLTEADVPASSTLGGEAFGVSPTPPPAPSDEKSKPWPPPGTTHWGAFDGDVLAARANRNGYQSHFGGVTIPTCGLGGVTVAAEYRGQGILTPLMKALLDDARERGEVLSTLFASAPGIYRRFGFELITGHDTVEIPITAAAAVSRPATEVRTRRAVAEDFDAIFAIYSQWASAQNGPLTRTGPRFPAVDITKEFTGVTLALGANGEVLGYASWDRGPDFGADAVLSVDEILATTGDAYRALWRAVGSFASIVGKIRVRSSATDPARLFLPPIDWNTIAVNPYMLRVDDVVGAFNARPLVFDSGVTFAVSGDLLGVMNGVYRLTPGSDGAQCEQLSDDPTSEPDVACYTPGGLALAWSGAQSSANLRMIGALSGDAGADAQFDRAFAGWPLHIRDGF